jgi:hypothetical protein
VTEISEAEGDQRELREPDLAADPAGTGHYPVRFSLGRRALIVEHLERRLQASWKTQGDLREILHLFPLGKRPANKSDG